MKHHDRLLELDGFRAIAVLLVFVLHICYGSGLPESALAWMPGIVRAVVSHGWLGVDLFFLLSGFLITGILMQSKDSERYFRNFYARRALRILPLYFACIVVMLPFYWSHAKYFALAAVFAANLAHLFHVSEPHGPGVFWSLAIEEHFYLLWPLFVLLLSRRRLLLVAAAIVVLTPVVRGVAAYFGMDPEQEIYSYSWFRFDGLALGSLIAIWWDSDPLVRPGHRKLAGCLLLASCVITLAGWPFGVMQTKTIAAVAFRYTQAQLGFAAAIVFALGESGRWISKPLRNPVLAYIAQISFCVYLIHLALIDAYVWIIRHLGWDDLASLGAPGVVGFRFVVIGAVTLAIADLSGRWFERPILSYRTHFAR